MKVLGQYKGVCRDTLVGGLDDNQVHTASRENGINVITYRRNLQSCMYILPINIIICNRSYAKNRYILFYSFYGTTFLVLFYSITNYLPTL